MKLGIARYVALCGLVVGTLTVMAQAPPPLLRTPNTTNISTGLPLNGEVPTFDFANNRWDYQLPPGAGGGEANTASTLGGSGSGLYVQKVGVDLQFNSIAAGLGLTLASNAYVLTFSPTVQYQQTNAALTALSATPNMYQATNANLTLLQAYGPTTWQATNGNLTLWSAITPFNTNFNYISATNVTVTNSIRSFGTAAFATATVNDDAYGVGWNGSTNVPTKNALYDKIETISGATNIDYGSANTYSVSNLFRSFGTANMAIATVNDDAYAVGWNGSTNVPSKNAIYDKIESLAVGGDVVADAAPWSTPALPLVAGDTSKHAYPTNALSVPTVNVGTLVLTNDIDGVPITNAPYVVSVIVQVNDDAYAAGWNGSTNVPTKNAVYDEMETKADLAGPALTGQATTTGNLSALLTTGETTYVNLNLASVTNAAAGAITYAHATNGVAATHKTAVVWLFNGSGSSQTLTIPAAWRTNVYSAVPPALTNNSIIKMVVESYDACATSATQTNVLVSFEYFR